MIRSVNTNRGELVERAAQGDQLAFSQLIRTHDQQMRALAYRLVGTQAAMDDALQAAYLNAFRYINSYEGTGAFAAWLRRIVVNSCRDVQRRQQRINEVSLDQLAMAGEQLTLDSPQFDDQLAQGDALQQGLDSLSDEHRTVVVLVNGQGLSYQEAADLCGVAEGTIGSRLSRAHQLLRAELENQQLDLEPQERS